MAINYTFSQTSRLAEHGIRHFDELIHDQSKVWLISNFKHGSTKYKVNVTKLIRNIIWQTKERIETRDREPYTELIRTFWYTHIKPTLARVGALSNETDQYNQLVENLVYLVVENKLMSYADIGFRDENQTNRSVGLNANVILFSEKIGHQSFLKEMSDLYQTSIISLGGQPSALNVEYFVRELKEKGVNIRRSFYLFGIVDYDPSGWIIRDAFVNHLQAFGIKNVKVTDMIHPDMLIPDEIKLAKYNIREKKETTKKNTAWLREIRKLKYKNQIYLDVRSTSKKRTIYGLEAESVSSKRIAEALKKLLPPLLGKSDRLLKINALEKLNSSLDQLILLKIR